MHHIYIFLTVILVTYSQLTIKWQVGLAGQLPLNLLDKVGFLFGMLFNPWVMSGLFATFMSGLTWMVAMTKFPISYAYPFTSLSFLLILTFSSIFFREPMTVSKIIGTVFIMIGVIVASQGG